MAIDYGSAAKYQQAVGQQQWTTTSTTTNALFYYTPGYMLPIEEEKKLPVPESALAWLDRRVQEMRVAL